MHIKVKCFNANREIPYEYNLQAWIGPIRMKWRSFPVLLSSCYNYWVLIINSQFNKHFLSTWHIDRPAIYFFNLFIFIIEIIITAFSPSLSSHMPVLPTFFQFHSLLSVIAITCIYAYVHTHLHKLSELKRNSKVCIFITALYKDLW